MPVTTSYNTIFETRLGELDRFIKELPIIVGGSCVVSVVSETEYPGSDIDVYVGYLLKKRSDGSIDSEFDDFIVHSMGGVIVKNINYQDKSYKYICPNITINVIHTGEKTKSEIIEYINSTADLDICASTYDGFQTFFPISILMKKAKVINEHLMQATFESSLTGSERDAAYAKFCSIFTLKRKTRQYKYAQRGFSIDGSSLDDFDSYNARTFIETQGAKEEYVRSMLRFIASEVKKNIELRGTTTLDDILQGRHIFTFRNDVPVFSIHHSLDFEMFPWARAWF